MSSFLDQYKRQPKIYIDLPSRGNWYPEGCLVDDQTVNIPVYAMTAMDEIMIKTPDALFNGESTVSVIKNCIPTIQDPWLMPSIDIDYVLIAIRIATYSEKLPIETACPKCGEKSENEINLTALLDSYGSKDVQHGFPIGDLYVSLKPITYREMTNLHLEEYSLQKQLVNLEKQNADLSEKEKEKYVNECISKLTKLNLDLAISHVDSISSGQDQENNPTAIHEFISQSDAVFYKELQKNVTEYKKAWQLPEIEVTCQSEECGENYQTKLQLDYSNFFALAR